MRELNFGLVGFGTIAPFYVQALSAVPNVSLRAICTPEESKRRALASKGYLVFEDAQTLFESPSVDAVIIATPNALHAPMSIAALWAGKHVLCEKPMAVQVGDAQKMVATANKVGRYVAVAFHNRYSPLVQDLLRDPRLSEIASFEAVFCENLFDHSDPNNTWYLQRALSGGGCVIDNGTNFIDVLYTLLGPLHVVTASLNRQRGEVEMNASVEFSFRASGHGTLRLDWQAESEEKRITFLFKDGTSRTLDFLSLEHPGMPGSHMNEEYRNIIEDFERAVAIGAPVEYQGIEVQKIVEEIYDAGSSTLKRQASGAK